MGADIMLDGGKAIINGVPTSVARLSWLPTYVQGLYSLQLGWQPQVKPSSHGFIISTVGTSLLRKS